MSQKKALMIDIPAALCKVTPVILVGGQDARLHPFTSPDRPKSFLKVASRYTLLQEALLRCRKMAPPVIVCEERWAEKIKQQAFELKIEPRMMIAEPAPRSTAPAITLAALRLNPEEIMCVMSSDHIIDDYFEFERTIARAAEYVRHHNTLVSIGIKPKAPETRYGYIHRGVEQEQHIYENLQIIENVNDENAQKYINSGEYLWNSGIFLTKIAFYGQKFTQIQPDLLQNIKNNYENAEKISIEHALLEKISGTFVTPLEAAWQDIGTIPVFLRVWLSRLFAIIKE
jgi:mannose-1-phosphate guanylyltransferase